MKAQSRSTKSAAGATNDKTGVGVQHTAGLPADAVAIATATGIVEQDVSAEDAGGANYSSAWPDALEVTVSAARAAALSAGTTTAGHHRRALGSTSRATAPLPGNEGGQDGLEDEVRPASAALRRVRAAMTQELYRHVRTGRQQVRQGLPVVVDRGEG